MTSQRAHFREETESLNVYREKKSHTNAEAWAVYEAIYFKIHTT